MDEQFGLKLPETVKRDCCDHQSSLTEMKRS